jgi:Fe2+ transport system protein FeoA
MAFLSTVGNTPMFETLRERLNFQPRHSVLERTTPLPQQVHVEALHECTPGMDCDDCPNEGITITTLPLCLVPTGESARIVHIEQGRRCRKRLADLGLATGVDVRVLRTSRAGGPMILAVRNDARLAIGRGMAMKIRVQLDV